MAMSVKLKKKLAFVSKIFAGLCIIIIGGCQTIDQSSSPSESPVSKTFKKTGKKKLPTSYAQFPGLPFPSGAIINTEKTTVVGSRPWFGQVSLSVMSQPGSVYEYYDTKMDGYSWQKIASVRAETSFLTYIKNDRVLSISIEPKTLTGSDVTITSSPLDKSGTASQGSTPNSDIMPVPVQKIN